MKLSGQLLPSPTIQSLQGAKSVAAQTRLAGGEGMLLSPYGTCLSTSSQAQSYLTD